MQQLITVGIPTFNSEAYLGLAIEGLLAQTFSDFELVVSDNASTDGTRNVVENYMSIDRRVRYIRHSENIGANLNYSHVVRIANGDFFKWSSSSDWCAPTFLEKCFRELSAHEDAVLVVPRTRLFESTPEESQDYPFDIEILDESPSVRLKYLMSNLELNNAMNGLIRTSALRKTRLVEHYRAADVVLMGHLAMLGKFRLIDERLFYRRMALETSTALQDAQTIRKFLYPRVDSRTLFQGCRRHLGWARSAWSAPMSIGDRFEALTQVAKACYWEKSVIREDFRLALKYALQRNAEE